MTDEQKIIRCYTAEMVDIAMKIWMRSAVSLVDIRSKKIKRDSPLKDYLLPTSMFIYAYGAPASIMLNQEPYQTRQYVLCHAGKGTVLSIASNEADIDVFMILYQAKAPSFYNRDLRNLMETINPFQQLYGFTPANPLFFMEKMQMMLDAWQAKESIDQFHAKALLYQVIHRVYHELKNDNIQYIEPDYVEWVKEYLDKHYTEAVSIQALSDMIPINWSVLGRLFRKRENSSMQEYLIRKRIESAKTYLRETNATLQEIAYGSGFTDEFNLIRMFKRYVYETPSEYRRKRSTNSINKVIDNDYQCFYNEIELDDLVKTNRDGEFTMFGQIRGKQMIFAAAMSLMLLLSGCASTAPTNKVGSANQNTGQVQQVQEQEQATAAKTRMVSTVMGDIEVPAEPQRIVGIQSYNILKSLEANAVDMSEREKLTYFSPEYNWEELMALEPDLIIASHYSGAEDDIKRSMQIAPTVVFEDAATVVEKQLFIGQAIGKEELAQKQIAEYEDTREKSIQKLKDLGIYESKVAILQYADDGLMYAYGNKLGRGGNILYDLLGFQAPDMVKEKINDGDEYYLQFSMESLPDYLDADYIVVMTPVPDMDAFYENGVWKSLKAVKEGKFFEFTSEEFMEVLNMPSLVEVQKSIELFTNRLESLTNQ